MSDQSDNSLFWRANLRLVSVCLVVWALLSYAITGFLRPALCGDAASFGDLSCWAVRNGPVLLFLVLIPFYAWRMNAIDRARGNAED